MLYFVQKFYCECLLVSEITHACLVFMRFRVDLAQAEASVRIPVGEKIGDLRRLDSLLIRTPYDSKTVLFTSCQQSGLYEL